VEINRPDCKRETDSDREEKSPRLVLDEIRGAVSTIL